MAWTADTLIAAYRLTTTPELTQRALDSGVERVVRLFGEPAYGGTVRWEWYRNRIASPHYLGLPEQCASMLSLTIGGSPSKDIYLANRGWTLRPSWPWAPLFLAVTATGTVVDDTAQRDALIATFALEQLGYAAEEQGRHWRTQLLDMSGPEVRGRLPDARTIITPGIPPAEGTTDVVPLYIGTIANANDPVSLDALTRQPNTNFALPEWNDSRYIVIARADDLPIDEIQIAGLDQTDVFASEVLLSPAGRFIVWRSKLAWQGEIASGAAVRITP